MPVAVLADAHLGGPGGSPDELIAQLEELPRQGCKRLILLGDLFHVWIWSRRFETPEVTAVLPVLRTLRRRGVQVDYVEGNRDFFLDRQEYADAVDSLTRETSIEVGGKKYLAVHGDGLDRRDRAYLTWRWFSKSAPSRFFMKHLPSGLAKRMLYGAEREIAKTNIKHKTRIPEEVLRRYAERRLAEGFDVLVVGHFHEPHRWRVEGGEVWLLDAWYRSRRIEWLDRS